MKEAVSYQGSNKASGIPCSKVNYDAVYEKENLGMEEKSLGSS